MYKYNSRGQRNSIFPKLNVAIVAAYLKFVFVRKKVLAFPLEPLILI